MRLYLVRHPQPLVESGICYGASDVACAASELQQAALNLLNELRNELSQGLLVISSPLQRCEQLAQVLRGLEPDFAYKTDARLAEMDFGAWEMKAWDEIDRAELSAWTDDFTGFCCGGSGESTGQFVQRVAQLVWESQQSGQDQVWITHAGVIRALQWLSTQPLALLTALVQRPAPLYAHPYPLRAADWPQGVVAFGRVQPWDWPQDWRLAQPQGCPPSQVRQ